MNIICIEPKLFTKDVNILLDSYATLLKSYLDENEVKPDIVVFPEFFSRGFYSGFNSFEYASELENGASYDHGPSLKWLFTQANKYDAAFIGSVPVIEGKYRYNRMYFVKPDMTYEYYDKRHIFRMSPEIDYFTPGTQRKIVNFRGFNILLQLCYDIRFPVWSRQKSLDYDLVINAAQWPKSRVEVTSKLSQARAIENQAYYLICNSAADIKGELCGGESCLSDYYGHLRKPIITSHKHANIYTFSIDKAPIEAFRVKFPAWMDADEFEMDNRY